MNVCYLAMNVEQAPLDDAGTRKVVALAIDRARVLRDAYHHNGQPATDLLPAGVPGRSLPIAPDYDLPAAQQLLAKVVRSSDVPLRLLFATEPRPYLPHPERTARIVAECLEKAGFRVELKGHDWETFRDRLRRGEHHLALAGWSSDNGDPDNFYSPLLAEAAIGATNYVRMRSAPFETLLAASQTEEDPVVRFDLFRRMQGLLAEELPLVPLVHTNLLMACRGDLSWLGVHPIKLRLYRVSRS
jgi:ABC-type transport system substrate-binding protein